MRRPKLSVVVVLIGMAACLICISAVAAEVVLVPSGEERRATIEEPLSFEFSLPEGAREIRLWFLARAEFDKPAGYTDALVIQVNEKSIEATRLVNKPLKFKPVGLSKEIEWYNNGDKVWRVPVSHDYTSIDNDPRYRIEGVKAHEFAFEISDLAVSGKNTLKIIRRSFNWSKIPVSFTDVRILYQEESVVTLTAKGKSQSEIPGSQISATGASFILAKEDKIPAEATKTYSLPVRCEGERTFLAVTCRRHWPTLGGYGYSLQMKVNGVDLDALVNRKERRLLNKAPSFIRSATGQETYWNLGDGIWLTFFSPDFVAATVSPYGDYGEEGYRYLLDITDLLRSEGTNSLTVTNLTGRWVEASAGKELPVFVTLEVMTVKDTSGTGPGLAKESVRLPVLREPFGISILENGGIEVRSGGYSLLFESMFSYPDGGFNTLGKSRDPQAEELWNPASHKLSDTEWELDAAGKFYSLKRKVSLKANRIEVSDTITNLSSEKLGIIFSNHFSFEGLPVLLCRMGGRTGQSINNLRSPSNPTLFFPLRESGLGIVANDNVYRNQAVLYYDGETGKAGIKDEMFALDVGASYTLSWSIYLTSSEDYYDFINLVRQDWGANITIDGPFYFVDYNTIARMPEETLKETVERSNPRYFVFWQLQTREPVPGFDRPAVAMGAGPLNPIFKGEVELLKEAVSKVRRVAPGAKIALYTHCFFNSPEKPDDPTFKDSWITNSQGRRAISIYNSSRYVDYQPVYPTQENSFGKEYDRFIDFYLNELGLDFIYWDESTGPGILGENYLTYNAWDGHSAKINPVTKRIEKECAILGLIANDYIMSVGTKVKDRDGFILFNGSAVTRERLEFPAFVESQDLISRIYDTHLNTPLAYGIAKPSMAYINERLNYGTLYARIALDFESQVVSKFYPITPEELHPGYIKGKERIITNRSGSYGWQPPFYARIYLFDEKGNLVNPDPPVEYCNFRGSLKVEVPPGGIAIMERVPEEEGNQ